MAQVCVTFYGRFKIDFILVLMWLWPTFSHLCKNFDFILPVWAFCDTIFLHIKRLREYVSSINSHANVSIFVSKSIGNAILFKPCTTGPWKSLYERIQD